MDIRRPKASTRGLSIIEVLMALVILGVISVVYLQTTRYAMRNTGKGIDWQAESVVIEKTIENLRVGHTVAQLQTLNTTTIDSTQGDVKIRVTTIGSLPSATIAKGFPPDRIAKISVTAKRDNYPDSLNITTYLWVN